MRGPGTRRPSGIEGEPATLTDVIGAVSERIHYAEGRRTNLTVVAGVLIAGGIALLTFVLDKQLALALWYALIAGSSASILVGAIILVAYARQTNRYPWTAATNTWKWFYRDALPEQAKFDVGWWSLIDFGKDQARVQAEYDRQLPLFIQRTKQLADPDVSYEQDVQQLYVLHINEKYKNIHLSQLRTIVQWGILFVIAAVAVGALLGAYSDQKAELVHFGGATSADYPVQLQPPASLQLSQLKAVRP